MYKRVTGQPIPDNQATLDHVLPRSRGGTNEQGNLVASCNSCNGKKGAMPYEAFVARMRIDASLTRYITLPIASKNLYKKITNKVLRKRKLTTEQAFAQSDLRSYMNFRTPFSIIDGHSVQVCKEYLQRLNRFLALYGKIEG